MEITINLDELKTALMSEFSSRAIRVSTVKEPHTYMKAVGTKELEKVLNKVFSDLEDKENKEDDPRYMKLEGELIMSGWSAVEEFVGYRLDPCDCDFPNCIREAYEQMPEEELQKFLDRYGIK